MGLFEATAESLGPNPSARHPPTDSSFSEPNSTTSNPRVITSINLFRRLRFVCCQVQISRAFAAPPPTTSISLSLLSLLLISFRINNIPLQIAPIQRITNMEKKRRDYIVQKLTTKKQQLITSQHRFYKKLRNVLQNVLLKERKRLFLYLLLLSLVFGALLLCIMKPIWCWAAAALGQLGLFSVVVLPFLLIHSSPAERVSSAC